MIIANGMAEIHFAPLQGYTDWIYRNNFARFFGGVDAYYTPFIRLESDNTFRNRDLRDIDPKNNSVPLLIPQILPGNADEFCKLTQLVRSKGYKKIDINLGCPFPLIAGKKKGAGMLPYPELVKEMLSPICDFPDVLFSVKMRLGWKNTSEAYNLIDIINNLRLEYITLHARIGIQQYKGTPDYESFSRFYQACEHSIFYNGDLKSGKELQEILEKFPKLRGVLIGRGLLSSPWVVADFRKNETKPDGERKNQVYAFHEALLNDYKNYLQGENQLLNKMKTLWDYLLPETDRKMVKRIRKSTKLSDYCSAVKQIFE
ncbi:tRNA-dihydrouridine synthase family protein [Odoribacter lunatus]|uniref:tRNA-dihydrouridine synthase family protein n=1 Tax=Odoribacter lunatus TaxID=2941335 RepID=UPI00203E7060|nr:tRNA-dihydrouridine synthase family protein [Odoribacter lunatus]